MGKRKLTLKEILDKEARVIAGSNVEERRMLVSDILRRGELRGKGNQGVVFAHNELAAKIWYSIRASEVDSHPTSAYRPIIESRKAVELSNYLNFMLEHVPEFQTLDLGTPETKYAIPVNAGTFMRGSVAVYGLAATLMKDLGALYPLSEDAINHLGEVSRNLIEDKRKTNGNGLLTFNWFMRENGIDISRTEENLRQDEDGAVWLMEADIPFTSDYMANPLLRMRALGDDDLFDRGVELYARLVATSPKFPLRALMSSLNHETDGQEIRERFIEKLKKVNDLTVVTDRYATHL